MLDDDSVDLDAGTHRYWVAVSKPKDVEGNPRTVHSSMRFKDGFLNEIARNAPSSMEPVGPSVLFPGQRS